MCSVLALFSVCFVEHCVCGGTSKMLGPIVEAAANKAAATKLATPLMVTEYMGTRNRVYTDMEMNALALIFMGSVKKCLSQNGNV